MFQLKNDTSAYYDFKIVHDRVTDKLLSDYLEVSIDFSKSFLNSNGSVQTEEVALNNITLNGLDNFFIPNGLAAGEIDPTISYQVGMGDQFQVWPVSGYTQNLSYDVEVTPDYRVLKGGFYQGFFKLHDYPVEYFDLALSKGWTANLTLFHNPTGHTNTLNELFPNNEGFVFYLGARAENKFNEITNVELEKIKSDYNVDFGEIKTTMYTQGGEFLLGGEPYIGRYNYTEGQYWTGYEKKIAPDVPSEQLVRVYDYADITNNAFGIRIKPDGRIGYRLLTEKDCGDLITTGTTTGSTLEYLWVEETDECTGVTINKLVTPDYKVVEQYSKDPVFSTRVGKYVNVTIVFERYFSVKSRCELKYSKFRKGTLKIYVNGFPVLMAKNVDEVFARELDTLKELQEAVPYVMSVGGGTQGLYEAVYLDPIKDIDGVLEKYFAGTYTGSLRNFSFYTTPANVTMIRSKTRQIFTELNIPINFGGRTIRLY